ncbi:MAG: bifunctional 5,10-methylenetetrahydrofolate dehydrogenase/5,10-methenyltetrahydrofolate cyclohydrolase, partial [Candidatus Daviesbacteria bacterium]|nr:bifunctional 5,10-methylenetetrahydrofolate dehydrogenase/5,10-methenyltetrahydrofolate cyclohydrolase [Candidatus Daviesbacteria bacterium]
KVQKLKVQPTFAIILAGKDPASRIYVDFKIKRANEIGVKVKFFEFSENQFNECVETIEKLNKDENVHGMIIQYPIYKSWNFDELVSKVDPKKDVDGFSKESPYSKATALATWEMLTAFAYLEGFSKTEEFLKDKKIVVLGRGKTAGGPIRELLESHGFSVIVIARDTKNPNSIIKKADLIISATGVKNIINGSNVKKGTYVIGVGVGREIVEGKHKIYGDINEEEISQIAKLYCPTVGGIGPLTIVSLLENVVSSAKRSTD